MFLKYLKALAAPTLGLATALPTLAFAWNSAGHQSIGAVADRLLDGTPAAAQVKAILGEQTLSTAAVWADCAEGVTSPDGRTLVYRAKGSNYPGCKPFASPEEQARLISYVSRNWRQCGTAHDREYCHSQYHFAAVSTFQDRYQKGLVGTDRHDLIHAINAAIAKLRGQQPEAPFDLADRREALMLLAHWVGDVHQPLHVVSLYLDSEGRPLDPDRIGYRIGNDTAGGNSIFAGARRLHLEWDEIPDSLKVGGRDAGSVLQEAQGVAPSVGDAGTWAVQWATESIRVGRAAAFPGLRFTMRPPTASELASVKEAWNLTIVDPGYRRRAIEIKRHQIARAGARLAQLLQAIWPAGKQAPAGGYLPADQLRHLAAWLPSAPASASSAEAEDIAVFRQTRPLLDTPRGQQAAEDDVYEEEAVAERFGDALGVHMDRHNGAALMRLIARMRADAELFVEPIKRPVGQGGRIRPFVAYPDQPTCLSPRDMANRKQIDIDTYHMEQTGSYPSTHALLGMLVGLVLGQAVPAQADALMQRGLEFGQSRVICGFHYKSDIDGGRLVAAALFARLNAHPEFRRDLDEARREIERALRP